MPFPRFNISHPFKIEHTANNSIRQITFKILICYQLHEMSLQLGKKISLPNTNEDKKLRVAM